MSTHTEESAPLWLGVPAVNMAERGPLWLHVGTGTIVNGPRRGETSVFAAVHINGHMGSIVSGALEDIDRLTLEWIRSIAALDPKLVAAAKVCEAAAALPMRGSTIVDTSELHAAIDAWEALP